MDETWLWILFAIIFVVAMVLDLFVFHRKAHVIPVKEALKLVGFWVFLALVFAAILWFYLGQDKAMLFLNAYIIEYSLSIDNLFVFLAIFTYFAVPREAQMKVLMWGILGVVFLRAIFIFAGIEIIERFHFLTWVLGAFLIYTAIKMITQKEKGSGAYRNPIVKFSKKLIRVSPEYHGSDFFTVKDGIRYATPLIIVLIAIDVIDTMFAIDSVPAVIGITTDRLIAYSSNMFAILGLRALFFAMAGVFYLFRYLSIGICFVLGFVGVKMLIADWVNVPVPVTLGVILAILASSIILSVVLPKKEEAEAPGQ